MSNIEPFRISHYPLPGIPKFDTAISGQLKLIKEFWAKVETGTSTAVMINNVATLGIVLGLIENLQGSYKKSDPTENRFIAQVLHLEKHRRNVIDTMDDYLFKAITNVITYRYAQYNANYEMVIKQVAHMLIYADKLAVAYMKDDYRTIGICVKNIVRLTNVLLNAKGIKNVIKSQDRKKLQQSLNALEILNTNIYEKGKLPGRKRQRSPR